MNNESSSYYGASHGKKYVGNKENFFLKIEESKSDRRKDVAVVEPKIGKEYKEFKKDSSRAKKSNPVKKKDTKNSLNTKTQVKEQVEFSDVKSRFIKEYEEVGKLPANEIKNYTKIFLNQLLHTAVKLNSVENVRDFLDLKADINSQGELGTPLHIAAFYNCKEVLSFLLENSADRNAQNGLGLTPLHLASAEGNSWVARLLLDIDDVEKQRELLSTIDNQGFTALDMAIIEGRLDTVSLLLEKRLDLQIAGDLDKYLRLSEDHGQDEVSKLLLNYGATREQKAASEIEDEQISFAQEYDDYSLFSHEEDRGNLSNFLSECSLVRESGSFRASIKEQDRRSAEEEISV